MSKQHWLFIFLGIICLSYNTPDPIKKNIPTNYFRSPVNGAIKLSGSFGELRSNHFHAGIDIKPKYRGRSGDDIYAAAEGYVSRIKVSPRGYGYGLYVTHPNGYTTVYGHLKRFNSKIERFVKEYQLKHKVFSFDMDTLSASMFPVQKGELIAYMGNRGSSGGAHLHFEIRDTKTEHALNPLMFGLKVADDVPPRLQELKIYYLNHKLETTSTKKFNIRKVKKSNIYTLPKEITVESSRIGLGLKTFDFMTGVRNWNGPYHIKMYQDDSLMFHFEASEISFDEWYYLNAHVDYREFKAKKSYFNRCYLLPGNGNSTIYKQAINRGVIELREGQSSKIKLIAEDYEGNKSSVQFTLRRKGAYVPSDFPTFNYIFPHNEKNAIVRNDLELYFDEGSFYEDVYLQYSYSIDQSNAMYSGVHHIHDKYIPIHIPYVLKIKPSRSIPDSLKSKATIVRCNGLSVGSGLNSEWEGDFLKTQTRSFGNFCIMLDTIPPVINTKRFKENMQGQKQFHVKITDEMSGIQSFDGYIDGRWVVLEYDMKTDRLIYYFDNTISSGKHDFKLVVKDNKNNTTIFEKSFNR
jgi:hypothetical protein